MSVSSVAAIGPGHGPYAGEHGEEYRLKGSTCYGAENTAALERFSQRVGGHRPRARPVHWRTRRSTSGRRRKRHSNASRGLAAEVYADGVGVSAVAPSLIVPTPGTVFHHLVSGYDDPRGEHPNVLARAVLLLATEELDKVSGRVCYSQQVLREFGWIAEGSGPGIDDGWPVSGYTLR